MSIRDWPASERPRERLLKYGTHALSDAEILAIFIRVGTKGKTAVDVSRDLIGKYKGLKALLEAECDELCRTPGFGVTKYVELQAAIELGRRYLESSMQREDLLSNPKQSRDYLKFRLQFYPYEVFACIFLDNRHRIICFEELFRGTIDGASVHPREVVRRGLYHNAAAMILAHNHPSGVAEPSQADHSITRRLIDALALVDIRVLDHVIIGDKDTVSFAERGLI